MIAERLGFDERVDRVTRLFAIKLLERVGLTALLTFVATYVTDILGIDGSVRSLSAITDLSIAHKALVAAVAAVVQLALSTLVAPHVGDPSSPDLVPGVVLRRLGALPAKAAAAIDSATGAAVTGAEVTRVLEGTLERLRARYGPDVPASVQSIAAEIAAQYEADKAAVTNGGGAVTP